MAKILSKAVLGISTALILLISYPSDLFSQSCTINPRVQNVSANVSDRIQNFMLYLPLSYSSNSTTKYPVIINWSGQSQIGGSFCDLLSNALPKVVNDGNFPETVSNGVNSYSFIVISPQIVDVFNVTHPPIDNVAEATAMLNYALANYRIDPSRIYMTGFSFGAYLLMDYATSSVANASKLAAIVPVANCFESTHPDHATEVSNIVGGGTNVWGLQCTNDPTCSTSWIQAWVNDINAAAPNSARFNAPCNGSHFAWDLVYPPGFTFPPDNLNIYQWMLQFASNFTLPAVIKNYSARIDNGKVIVDWTTTGESNSDYFVLERASADMDFKAVNTVTAAGNSSSDKKYSLVDEQPLKGPSFYRLALVNRDSKKEYYEVKKINIPARWNGMVNIPNPVHGAMSVYLDIPSRQTVTIGLYDLNGKLLKQVQKEFAPGISENKVDVSSFSKGTYLVRVSGENISTAKKILIN